MKLTDFIKREKPYAIMLAFVLMFNALAFFNAKPDAEPIGETEVFTTEDKIEQLQEMLRERFATKEGAEAFIKESAGAGVILSLFIIAGFFAMLAGLLILMVFTYLRFRGVQVIKPTFTHKRVRWEVSDILRAVIVLMLLGACLSAVSSNMMLTTMIYDIFAVGVVLAFVTVKYRQKLKSLGLSLKNLFKNVIIGIIAYLAVLPVLFAVLLLVMMVVEATGFKPPIQPAVEIFIKESRPAALFYFTLFISALGPFAEEVFFRAFAYSAIKKRLGIKTALFIVALLFAALHADKIAFLPILTLGLLLGWLYEKTGSLVPSFTAHLIHNSVTLSFVFLIKRLLSAMT